MDKKNYLFIVGAPKCATSSLAGWLATLRGAVLARGKETLFFTDFARRSWSGPGHDFAANVPRTDDAFRALFDHDPEASLRIEASTDNLANDAACDAIGAFARRDDVGSVKLVAVTRDPVARIVSEFEHTLRLGWQGPDLLASLHQEDTRRRTGWHPLFYHIARSRYATQISRYRARFGSDLLVLDYHTLSEPETLMRLAAFSGRDPAGAAEPLARQNTRAAYARPRMQRILSQPLLRGLGRAVVPGGLRSHVRSFLRGPPKDRYVPTAQERSFILEALGPEIEACRADPEISTMHWTSLETD